MSRSITAPAGFPPWQDSAAAATCTKSGLTNLGTTRRARAEPCAVKTDKTETGIVVRLDQAHRVRLR
jgi:hypothetical protein